MFRSAVKRDVYQLSLTSFLLRTAESIFLLVLVAKKGEIWSVLLLLSHHWFKLTNGVWRVFYTTQWTIEFFNTNRLYGDYGVGIWRKQNTNIYFMTLYESYQNKNENCLQNENRIKTKTVWRMEYKLKLIIIKTKNIVVSLLFNFVRT